MKHFFPGRASQDLNYLLAKMIAELSTSHTYVGGGDQPTKPHVSVGMLGADFEPDGGYFRITRIYAGETGAIPRARR